jgi:hypothetical protein
MTKKQAPKPEKVWVEIEVNKFTEGITVFRGQIVAKELEAWANGELLDCSLKIENTYWYTQGKAFVLGKGDNNTKHYTGETYLRVDTIMAIFVLRDTSFPKGATEGSDNIFQFPGRA